MLLDLYVLKKGFQELPTLTSKAGTMPPARCVPAGVRGVLLYNTRAID